MDKGELRARIEAQGLLFAPQTQLPPQIIDQYAEYAVRRVWRFLIAQREHEFRYTVTLNHGNHLPDDWVAYADRAHVALAGNAKPVGLSYIPTQMIGTRQRALYNRATPSKPDIYFVEQSVYFNPNSSMLQPDGVTPYPNMQNVTVYFYKAPPKLFGDTIPDNTDIGLPDFACMWAIQIAYTYVLIHFMSAKKRAAYSERLRQDSIQSIQQFVAIARGLQDRPLQSATRGANAGNAYSDSIYGGQPNGGQQ